MNVLMIYAHPESHSLNGALNKFAVSHLENAGHHVQVSDLYAMNWKSQLDADDTLAPLAGDHFHPSMDSKQAFEQGLQSADIAGEQEKLRWADAVIFQFPLWWFSMPAIMKGWFDRVWLPGVTFDVLTDRVVSILSSIRRSMSRGFLDHAFCRRRSAWCRAGSRDVPSPRLFLPVALF